MSYTEYLRSKMAAQKKIVDTRENTDASTYTWKLKIQNSAVYDPSRTVLTNVFDPWYPTGKLQKVQSFPGSGLGGKVPDASSWTLYQGHSGAGAARKTGKVTLDGLCCANTQAPSLVVANGQNAYGQSLAGVGYTGVPAGMPRAVAGCCTAEPHNAATLGPSVMVDTATGLKLKTVDPAECPSQFTPAIHTVKEKHSLPLPADPLTYKDRLNYSPSLDMPYKQGAAVRNKYTVPYVEKHHGNDLNVNPRQPLVGERFQTNIPPPAQLKINDPHHSFVA